MKQEYYDVIKYWDDEIIYKHVHNNVKTIAKLFHSMEKESINYIDVGFNVGKVYDLLAQEFQVTCDAFEINELLIEYDQQKYGDNLNVHLYHEALSNQEEWMSYNTYSFDNQLAGIETVINLGGSRLDVKDCYDKIKTSTLSSFIQDSPMIFENTDFIKTDTESKDAEILEDILSVLDLLPHLKVIESEINWYILSQYSFLDYEKLLHQFVERGFSFYTKFTDKGTITMDTRGDVLLIRTDIEPLYEYYKQA